MIRGRTKGRIGVVTIGLPKGWQYPWPTERYITPIAGAFKDVIMDKDSLMAKSLGWPNRLDTSITWLNIRLIT